MNVLRLMVGITGGLIALFAGGCSVYILALGGGDGMGFLIFAFGICPAALGATVAWWAFNR